MLIDGRNRLAACSLACEEPTFTVFDGDPIAYILGANVRRRQMTKAQIAIVAVDAAFP